MNFNSAEYILISLFKVESKLTYKKRKVPWMINIHLSYIYFLGASVHFSSQFVRAHVPHQSVLPLPPPDNRQGRGRKTAVHAPPPSLPGPARFHIIAAQTVRNRNITVLIAVVYLTLEIKGSSQIHKKKIVKITKFVL